MRIGLFLGIIAAIIAFLKVGPWYDETYGFEGSLGAAIVAAILSFVVVFLIFAIIQWLYKTFLQTSKDNKINFFAKSIKNDGMIKRVAAELFNCLSYRIEHITHPITEEYIYASVYVIANADSIEYSGIMDVRRIDLNASRVFNLNSQEEQQAVVIAIAEIVLEKIQTEYPIDSSINNHTFSIEYSNSYARADIIYKCKNNEYVQKRSLF